MAFNFQKFTDTDTSFVARITVRQTGQLGFNAGAINRFDINSYEKAILYFDPVERVVGIELTNENSEGAIDIKRSPTNTYIRAKNFCDRFEIDYKESHRFELQKDSDTGLLIFELAKEITKDSVSD
ncbi:hypothetical protein [Bremerella sp. P1]|uniref:hypothetical protein n=1 Tax=Bremerella sp. P1 TaxID=3026424 RepID=UPI002368F186|nr:hypothetical protein [Bremerella sp. P1]WDI40227.1 hypothetical protein PSR63_17240 [Bremerella sp. P1]